VQEDRQKAVGPRRLDRAQHLTRQMPLGQGRRGVPRFELLLPDCGGADLGQLGLVLPL
jgi:hypothetical protein